MDSKSAYKLQQIEAERKKINKGKDASSAANQKRLDVLRKEESALIKASRDAKPTPAPAPPVKTNTLSKSDQRADALGVDRREYASNPSKYDNASKNAMVEATKPAAAVPKATGYALTSTKGLEQGDVAALTAEANQLRGTIREFWGNPEVTDRAEQRLNQITAYLVSGAPIPPQNTSASTSLPSVNWVDEVWDKTPVVTAEQMANRGNGSVTTGAQGNSVADPKLQAGIIKDVDTNLGDRVEKITKTVGNTDPTIAGSGRMIGGKPDTPWSGPATPTGQGALPAPTIGSGSVGTTDAVAKAVAALGQNADPYTVAQTVKQTVIAYGGSTDAANNMAAKILIDRGVPMGDALRVASSVPNSMSGTTGAPPAGYGSPAPGVTSNGVTGVNGSVSNAGTVTADAITGMPGGSPPTPIAGATGSSPLVNGGTGTVQTPVVPPVGGTPPVVPPVGGTPPVVPPVGGAMSNLEITALVASLVSAGMSVYQANQVAQSAKDAAQIQAAAADRATDLQKKMYDQNRTDLVPWRSAGEEALGYDRDVQGHLVERQSGGLRTFEQDNPNFQMDQFGFQTTGPNVDPSYSFRLSEGMKTLENSAAAKGMLRSGNTLKAITDYGQGAASQEYSNAFNRYQTTRTNAFNEHNTQRGQKLNALQSLAGVGQTAVTQMGNAGQNYATGAGNAMLGSANARADGINSAAAANAAGWNGAAAIGNNYLSQALNRSTGLDYARQYGYGG